MDASQSQASGQWAWAPGASSPSASGHGSPGASLKGAQPALDWPFDSSFGRPDSGRQARRSSVTRLRRRISDTAVDTYKTVKSWDAYRWAVVLSGSLSALWCVAATAVLFLLAYRYLLAVIPQEQAAYVAPGAAEWAQAEAARTLGAAHGVLDALRLALRAGWLRGSWDLATLEQVLAPALAMAPAVRGAELVFADSPSVLAVSADRHGVDGLRIGMQSNAADCYLLGVHGCMHSNLPPTRRPQWYQDAQQLPTASASRPGEADGLVLPGDAAAWEPGVEMVLERGAGNHWADRVWRPEYHLLFRLASEDGAAALSGRIRLEVGGLSGERLQDGRLGERARIYVCDRVGGIVASREAPDLAAVLPQPSGRVVARRLGDLPAAAEWAGAAQEDLDAGEDVGHMVGKFFLAVRFLPVPLGEFAVVVVVPDRGPFTHGGMESAAGACVFCAAVPCVAVAALGATRCKGKFKGTQGGSGSGPSPARRRCGALLRCCRRQRRSSRRSSGALGGQAPGEAGQAPSARPSHASGPPALGVGGGPGGAGEARSPSVKLPALKG